MTVELAALEQGADHPGSPLVILHGLFGSARNWQSIARSLAAKRRVIAFDLRNHGASGWAATMSYAEMAEDVRAALARRGISQATLLGHSMGGKVAMTMALDQPLGVDRLIVVDIAPTAHPPVHDSLIAAMRDLDLSDNPRRSEAETRLAQSITDAGVRLFLLQNLVSDSDGLKWRINLRSIEASLPELSSFPKTLPERRYDGPTLVVAGGRSNYIKSSDQPVFGRLFPNYRLAEIPDAGHWVHAEQPKAFLETVDSFLG